MERFLADAQARARYTRELRATVEARYSYRRRMADMLRFIRDGYAVEASQPAAVPV